jgi:hypothetical protein
MCSVIGQLSSVFVSLLSVKGPGGDPHCFLLELSGQRRFFSENFVPFLILTRNVYQQLIYFLRSEPIFCVWFFNNKAVKLVVINSVT